MGNGTLFLVATPIGNLEDITLRALRILKEVDLIVCEDTRRTAKILNHYGIKTPRESHHEHNEAARTPALIQLLLAGKNLALVSDAGTPLLSDPGFTLVSGCLRRQLPVVPVPGPSAVVTALVASGLAVDSFFFAGFLPVRTANRRNRLQELADVPSTLILYEAPHRIIRSLEDMVAMLGPRKACLARELTKLHEEWLRGTLPEILELLRARAAIPGEITLVIERGAPPEAVQTWPDSLKLHVEEEMQRTGMDRKEALKRVARQRGLSRKQAYNRLLEEREN
jgi:16S rRNA (cytidine1402-2'-O)-methyltransferase